MRKPTIIRLLLWVALFLFFSCKKEENFTSRISFFNGVIGAGPITLKADNISIADTIRYDSLKPDVVVPSGTFTISLTRAGQSQNVLLTNLGSNETYTAVVYDSLKRAAFFMRKDVLPVTPGFGRCAVRIYTLIPDAASLYLANDTARPFITGKTFNDFVNGVTSPAFEEIDTIPQPIIFRGDSIKVVSVARPFRSGKIYTLFLTGSIKDSVLLPPKCIVQMHN